MTEEANEGVSAFDADWWNEKLDTEHGEEISSLLKIHAYPLVLRPAIPGAEFVVRHIFSRLGITLKEVVISEDISLVQKALKLKIIERNFFDIVREHKMRNLDTEGFVMLERVHNTFGRYWRYLEEKWDAVSDAQENIFSRRIGAKLVFQYLLSDLVVFTALGKREVVSDYLCCLELFLKGNYILGQFKDETCLVVVAPGTSMN